MVFPVVSCFQKNRIMGELKFPHAAGAPSANAGKAEPRYERRDHFQIFCLRKSQEKIKPGIFCKRETSDSIGLRRATIEMSIYADGAKGRLLVQRRGMVRQIVQVKSHFRSAEECSFLLLFTKNRAASGLFQRFAGDFPLPFHSNHRLGDVPLVLMIFEIPREQIRKANASIHGLSDPCLKCTL